MASRIHNRGVEKPSYGYGARVLLVNSDPEELSYYGGILQEMRCQVRTSSSFAKGAQCLERERYDLIFLDQGSSSFEGRHLLMTAMEVDTEVPVLVLARSFDRGCCEEAMQSGALDYIEGPLSEAEIVAFLETFAPCRSGSRRSSSRVNSARPNKNAKSEADFKSVPLEKRAAGGSREALQL